MDVGQFDQRIIIETEAPVTTNSLGEELPGWLFLTKLWAKATEQKGREFLAADGDYRPQRKVAFTIRWMELDSTARVKWRGLIYRIEDVTGTKRSGWAWLHCESTGETY